MDPDLRQGVVDEFGNLAMPRGRLNTNGSASTTPSTNSAPNAGTTSAQARAEQELVRMAQLEGYAVDFSDTQFRIRFTSAICGPYYQRGRLSQINRADAYMIFTPPGAAMPVSRKDPTMLEQLLKLYTTSMISGVTSPMPHVVGPPGTAKSMFAQQLADLVGKKLHVVNVSRISPLGLEGLEMPTEKNTKLRLLISEMWTKVEEGDILFFDEFLRGFPEVYNGLLDIFTAREVAGYKLPRVFIMGASNSVATYDGALEDRLLHIRVPDIRIKAAERKRLYKVLVDELGLNPELAVSSDMSRLFEDEVLPTYEMLDKFDKRGMASPSATIKGSSLRKLIGQAHLRQIESTALKELIDRNNLVSSVPGKFQYVFIHDGRDAPKDYKARAIELRGNPKLTPIQAQNLEINLQLIEMAEVMQESTTTRDEEKDDYPFEY